MNFFTPYIHIHNQQKDQSRPYEKNRNRNETTHLWSAELSRLLSAAVVNQRFCQLLLTEPRNALDLGFNGESFALSAQEESMIFSIQANTLQSFTQQLLSLYGNGADIPLQPDTEPEERAEEYKTPTIQIRSLVPLSI